MQTQQYLNTFTPSQHQEQSGLESLSKSNLNAISPQLLVKQFKTYQPKSDIIDMSVLKVSEYLKLKKYKGATFFGEFLNKKRQGVGIMVYHDQRVFEGEWQNDLKHGKGFQLFLNGCIYNGFYVNGKPQGSGRYEWPNGQFYEGQWLSGMRHGSGMWNGAKGDSYVGEWRCGRADGFGVHVWINGDRYQGEFKQNLKHGQGTQKFSSGDIYKGKFIQGKPNGYGEYYWLEGSFYKGTFKNGFREGHGVWKKNVGNSDKYEGDYYHDKKQGYGIYTWETGNVYKGNYQNDIREGYGEMYWRDGSYYRGEWKRGNQEGEGTLFLPQEGSKKGRFSNNVLVQLYDEMEDLKCQPIFKKTKIRRVPQVDRLRALSNPFQNRYNPRLNNLKVLVKQKVVLNGKTPTAMSKNRSSKMRTAVPTPSNPSTARALSSRQIHHQSLQNKELFSIKQTSKELVPHSSIRMKYLDRRIHMSSAHQNRPYGRIRRNKEVNTSLK